MNHIYSLVSVLFIHDSVFNMHSCKISVRRIFSTVYSDVYYNKIVRILLKVHVYIFSTPDYFCFSLPLTGV